MSIEQPEKNQDEDTLESFNLLVGENENGFRLDKAVALLCPQFSRTRLKTLIEDGDCLVNGAAVTSASAKVKTGDAVVISLPPLEDCVPQPENIPLDIVYEDDALIVINKPAGMVVHPAIGNETGTLVNALLYHCGDTLSGINGVKRPGIVHRLDKETTGLMLAAKTDHAHQHLSAQLQDRSLTRVYAALVYGIPFPEKGKIEFAIGRHQTNRLKMAVVKGGRDALTYYAVMDKFRDALSLVECRLATGRTHQIRVHFEKIKHPLIGDPLYGVQETGLRSILRKNEYDADVIEDILHFSRQALHAREISFIHPDTEEVMSFRSDLPKDMENLLSRL